MQPDFIVPGGIDEAAALYDEFKVIAAPTHTQAKKFLAFWNARPKDGIVMGRDLPSRAIADILSNVFVSEPVNGGGDYRVRLAGAAIRRRFGGDIKDMLMSQMFPPEDFQHHLKMAAMALESDTPCIVDSRLRNVAVEKLHLEVVVLPMWSPDRTEKWTLVGLFYFD